MTGPRATLNPGELTIARARVRARDLAQRLATSLIDRQLYQEMQEFLDLVGFRACDALEALAGCDDQQLRHRLHLVLGIGAHRGEDVLL